MINFDGFLKEITLQDFSTWCIASRWEIDDDAPLPLHEYLAHMLLDVRLGDSIDDLVEDDADDTSEIDQGITKLVSLHVRSKQVEISELACYAVLRYERKFENPTEGRFLDTLVEKGAPGYSDPGIDALAIELAMGASVADDHLIIGEVKSAIEQSGNDPLGTLRQQINRLVYRFGEQVPGVSGTGRIIPELLRYELRRLTRRVVDHTGDQRLAKRVRRFTQKYTDKDRGITLLSFLVFDRSWLDEPAKCAVVLRHMERFRFLSDAWSPEQTQVMLFPLERFPGCLQDIYEALWLAKDRRLKTISAS
jgi:hypothetical protein